ncbi:hypothetical protein Glove_184g44 [Diversispora epigaea]|uniref:Uncharacterized protein n=1 Tax=Diversispora epigaea TaxID=1348612 RepID=A0A397IR23_9GLOM|nr:hypothetical protein Glove_184g44 [Diversispora epigaea]
MKNLVTFALIIITFINTFNNFAFALSSPLKRRGNFEFNEILSDLGTCTDSGYFPCSDGSGCCPIGSSCISGNKCSVSCTSADVYCDNGSCCKQGQTCGTDGFCHSGSSSTSIIIPSYTYTTPTYTYHTPTYTYPTSTRTTPTRTTTSPIVIYSPTTSTSSKPKPTATNTPPVFNGVSGSNGKSATFDSFGSISIVVLTLAYLLLLH